MKGSRDHDWAETWTSLLVQTPFALVIWSVLIKSTYMRLHQLVNKTERDNLSANLTQTVAFIITADRSYEEE